ncbi:hypothetical protein BDY24DRAFT_381656 [Mrakia frigida]|uniref:uncharacterized protein n=1 Tax=Mrakia frigida TaxID=29902 RepID=UPI003FCC14E6
MDPSPLLPPPPPPPSTDSLVILSTSSPTETSTLPLPVQTETQPAQQHEPHAFATSLPSLSLPRPQPTPSSSSTTIPRPSLPHGSESYSDRARRLLQEQAEPAQLAAEQAARRDMERSSEERMERMRRRSEGDDRRTNGNGSGREEAVSYAERARRMLVQREVRLRGFDEETIGRERSLLNGVGA